MKLSTTNLAEILKVLLWSLVLKMGQIGEQHVYYATKSENISVIQKK